MFSEQQGYKKNVNSRQCNTERRNTDRIGKILEQFDVKTVIKLSK